VIVGLYPGATFVGISAVYTFGVLSPLRNIQYYTRRATMKKHDVIRKTGSAQHIATAPERQISLTSKLNKHGLSQYGAEPHYSTLPFWQLYALKG